MAIAHDATVTQFPDDTNASVFTANISGTHSPVGTLKGVLVIIAQSTPANDEVSGVTYGGVAMTRVRSDARTVTEQMREYIYFLGSDIPTGAQTVAITLTTQTAVGKHAFVLGMTAAVGQDVAVDSSNGQDLGIVANGQITVTHSGTLSGWAGYDVVGHGGTGVLTTGQVSGLSYVDGSDPGTPCVHMVHRRNGPADASSSIYGYTTSASDDHLISAVVLKEVAAAVAGRPLQRRHVQPRARRAGEHVVYAR